MKATTHYVPTAPSLQSRAYAQSPNLQARFNTLVRKASQLCAMSDSEVYLVVRHGGSFYVYNSVDVASRQAPEPEVRIVDMTFTKLTYCRQTNGLSLWQSPATAVVVWSDADKPSMGAIGVTCT
jgi:hypothetical protein